MAINESTSSTAASADCVRSKLMQRPTDGRPSSSAAANPSSMASIISRRRPCQAVQWEGLTITSA